MARGTRDWGRTDGGLQSVAEFDAYVSLATPTVTVGLGETFIHTLFNPAGSGKLMPVTRVWLDWSSPATGTHHNALTAQLYRISEDGIGTAVTPRPLDPNSPAATAKSKESHTVDPTTSHLIELISIELDRDGTAGAGRTTDFHGQIELYRLNPGAPSLPLRLRPGTGIAISVGFGAGTFLVASHFEHSESPE